MNEAYILSAVRTPIGRFLGELSELPATKLGALAVAESIKRANVSPEAVDEVILGNVVQAGVGQAPARQAALGAGLPDSIAAVTVNKVCGSGLKAVMLAAQAIKAGDAHVIVAGGMESMSRAPFLLPNVRGGYKYGDQKAVDALVHDGLWCAFENWHMGEAAEHIAARCSVSRADQDRFAVQSHQRAAVAWGKDAFANEILSVTVGSGSRAKTISRDEGIRPDSTIESMSKLRPAFRNDGSVTAGNASQLSDGAASVVVASRQATDKANAKPLARIVSYATSGVHPKDIFIAPVQAVHMAIAKAGLRVSDIDLFELNEAFAAQAVACNKGLEIDATRVNVNGGAIALGHPIGASGCRILVTLLHVLQQRGLKRGVASLCLGGGNAVAMVVESM
jgi:acetyl-CoA C-acetyltransferase